MTTVIDVEPAAAWDLLVETDRWPEWGPSVRAVECEDQYIHAGSTGRVGLPGGLWLPFEIDSCSPPGEEPGRWTWHVARVPATGHRVDPLSGERCRVGFELPVLAAGYAPVCRLALGRIETLLDEPDERECSPSTRGR